MSRIWLLALMNGLRLALLAPPIAAAFFGLVLAIMSWQRPEAAGVQLGDLPGVAVGLLTGAYVVGLLPAFLAGCALPWISARLRPPWAACTTGALGLLAYLLTFGSHLFGAPGRVLVNAVPAFLGVALPAFVVALRGVDG